jgi:high-affinity iron transporter
MNPAPADLLSSDAVESLTPARVFIVTRFGIPDTAMPTFPSLSESDRWDVAIYVLTMRHPPCRDRLDPLPLEELSDSADSTLAGRHGEHALACLRRRLRKDSPRREVASAASTASQ